MGMRTGEHRTALSVLTWRRLPVSSWPWRSAGYLLTTLPIALLAFTGLAIPWLLLAVGWRADDYQVSQIVLLLLLGAALVAALGPLIAVPVASLERARLRIVDTRPVGRRRPPQAAGLRSWLRAHYTDPATWCEVGYLCLLATVMPVLSLAALFAVPLTVAFIASPFLVAAQRPGDAPVALAFGQVTTVEQTVPYLVAGVLLTPLIPYLLALVAGGHAAVARGLLLGGRAEHLHAELVEVSRSRARLADAFEAERHRIQRDLHDGAQQKLVSLTMQLGLAKLDLPPGSPAADSVNAAHQQAKELMAELRALIHGIQPQILTELGLPAALEELVNQSPIQVTAETQMSGRPSGQIENTAYFIVAEALTNIAKHSGATSARVTVRQHRGVLTIEVTDDGRGGADPKRGTGLTGLADRAAVSGGRMLLSSPVGGPTLLRVELPWTHHQPASE